MNSCFAETLIDELQRDEGFVSSAYLDTRGFTTIGYGRLIDKSRGGGITKDEALFLLRNDIEDGIRSLDRKLPWWRRLDDTRQRALLNMHYNLGLIGLLGFHKMIAALKRFDYDKAAMEALDSEWARELAKLGSERAVRVSKMLSLGDELESNL